MGYAEQHRTHTAQEASGLSGFHQLLHGLLVCRPKLVHQAFDSAHLHLLWLPQHWVGEFLYKGIGYIEATNALEELSHRLHRFPKLMNVDLRRDMECLILYIATSGEQDQALLMDTVQLILDSTFVLAQRDGGTVASEKSAERFTLDELCGTMPGLDAGELVHPTLPILIFAAHLLWQSPSVARALLEGGFLDTLRQLWIGDFAIPSGMSTGKWVPVEKRLPAMRIVCCVVLGAFAAHEELRVLLAAFMVSNGDMASWFWDIAAHAMCLYVNKSDPRAARWAEWCKPVAALAAQVMRDEHKMPADYDYEKRVEEPENLVWIFQTW